MTQAKAGRKKSTARHSVPKSVGEFMETLDHPLKPALEAVRKVILGADPAITEGIKWNSASFRVQEWFATLHIRAGVVQVILHLGAKVKDNSTTGLAISDPTGLLEWLATDRATVKFADIQSVGSKRRAFEEIVRQWIAYVR